MPKRVHADLYVVCEWVSTLKKTEALLKAQVKLAYRGAKATNATSGLVAEYFHRKSLAKLGFTSSMSDLPCWKFECFTVISSELSRLEKEELNKAKRKR